MAFNDGSRTWRRREFLATGAATAAGMLTLGRAASARGFEPGPKAGPYGPFQMGLQSYSLRGYKHDGKADVKKALALTKELGLHHWEGYPEHFPLSTDAKAIAEYKKELADAGVTLGGYGVVPLTKDAKANRPYFEFAKAMGLKYLSASPTPDSFDVLDKLVEEFDVAVGIHNHGPGDRFAKIETIIKAVKDHHPKIGCCIDTGHFLRSREDPVHAAEVFGRRVFGVHLKDVKDATKFTIMGQGDLRTADLFKALIANHYDYPISLEYEENPENPIADIKACLAEVRKVLAAAPKKA